MNFSEMTAVHKKFWQERKLIEDRVLFDPDCAEFVLQEIVSESRRGVPFKGTKNVSMIIADLESKRKFFQRRFSSNGGKSRKGDNLQAAILVLVDQNPDISQRDLELKLRRSADFRVDRQSDLLAGDSQLIRWEDDRGKTCTAPLSGLKDRLRRARKQRIARSGSSE